MKKLIALLLAMAMTSTFFASCSTDTDTDTDTDSTQEVSIGISAYPAFYIWYICEAEGIFEEYDLDVDLQYFSVYSDSVQAFSTGQLDMLALAMPDTIAPFITGIDFSLVFVNENSSGADGLVAGEGIETIADLEGKSIATEYGTIEHFFMLKMLETAGLTEDDVEFVNLSIADSAPAFISGSVDAASLWEPSLSLALTKENSNLLASSEDVEGLIPDGVVASGDIIENNSDVVTSMLNAYFDALEFYVENEEQAIIYMAEGAEITVEEMEVSMSGSRLFSLQEAVDTMTSTEEDYTSVVYTLEEIAEFLQGVEMIDSIPDNLEDMIDVSFLEEILTTRESTDAPNTKD